MKHCKLKKFLFIGEAKIKIKAKFKLQALVNNIILINIPLIQTIGFV